MRFSLFFLAPAVMALADISLPSGGNLDSFEVRSVEARDTEAHDVEARAPLEARACVYNGCKCDTTRHRDPQGQFCGTCHWSDGSYVITAKRVANHVYECNPNGKCCDYGYASNCKGKNTDRCGQ